MGGRGGASHRSTAGGAAWRGLTQRARTMGIRLDIFSFDMASINPAYVRYTLNSVEKIYKEFPAMSGKVQYIDAEETNSRAYASAGGDGGLHLGQFGRMSEEQIQASWKRDLLSRFHPQGTSYKDIFVHEMGHQMEAHLNRRDYGSPWAWGKTADAVVFEAVQKLDPTIGSLHSDAAYKLALDISRYAVNGYDPYRHKWATWETLAEAVQDYYSNGENAKPLSKEIWNIMKRKLK